MSGEMREAWNALPRAIRALIATLAVGLFVAGVLEAESLIFWATDGSLWGLAAEMAIITYVAAWNICRKAPK